MRSEKKNTLPLKFKLPKVDTLLALSSIITPCKKNNFICRYGQILDLLTTYVDVSTLVALSQYYDPPLRCFTFKDFQLAPTIEEYEKLLGWYMKDHPPFIKLGELLMPKSVVEALHLSVEEESYRQWVVQREKKVKLPYSVDIQIPPPVPEPLYASKEEVDALKSTIAQLTKENEDLRSKLHALDRNHAKLKKRVKKILSSYQKTENERGDNHCCFELVVKEKNVLRDESDLEIQKLKLSLREDNAKVEVERRLKEEAIRNESLDWLKEKAQINSLLDTYVGSINLLQPAAAMYRAKYDGLTVILAFFSVTLIVKLTSHFYNTIAKQKIAMERIEQNQTAIQEEMTQVRAQLGELMDIMQNVVHGQEENLQANPGVAANMNAINLVMGNGVPVVTHAHAEEMPNNLNDAYTFHVPVHGGSQG
ncbi:hypothetical protein KIW84_011024 [Lathyrus oleraceus]|uniref:DUF7745 domain-containing protein n=1 Tax=Pisum sativum TaxID=3888 RepID=A0A9D5BE74_PEA|nr:hypothetical protein KIW84_011024 [Pisum sativum]